MKKIRHEQTQIRRRENTKRRKEVHKRHCIFHEINHLNDFHQTCVFTLILNLSPGGL